MKTLFILVSVLALGYLALQTSLVREYVLSVAQQFSHQGVNKPIENNMTKEFITKINELEKQSARERGIYTQRISELELNVAALKLDIQRNINAKLLTTNAINEVNVEQHPVDSSPLQIENEATLSPNSLEGPNLASRVDAKQSSVNRPEEQIDQQQKRIQQQAVLRQLSQKMELAALSSLAN